MILHTFIFLFIFAGTSFGQENEVSNANAEASSLKVPYMTPMILGRTYDYATNEVGDDIFDQAARDQKHTIKHYRTNIQYKMVNDVKDVQDVLDVSGELSLKVKAGLLDISGSGSYLKEESDKTNFVEVLVKVEFETLTETLHSSIQPMANWKSLPVIGKHYVRSITYGGMMIASMRFYAKSGKSLEDIKAQIDGKVNAASLSVGVQGQFKKLASSVSDTSDLVIKYYSTVMLEDVPQDQDGLEKAIKNFPELVKKQTDDQGNVRGVPLYSNVISLSTLDPGNEKLAFIYDSLLASHLGDLEEMYDDLLSTDRLVKGWLKNQYKLNSEDEVTVAAFYSNLAKIIQQFESTIASLNTECDKTAADDSQNACGFNKLADAFKLYGGNDRPSPRKYYREFCKVQEAVELADDKLATVGRDIDNSKRKTQSYMRSLDSRFSRILGVKGRGDAVQKEFLRQKALMKTLLEKAENILPGHWFNADFSKGDEAISGYEFIPFTKTEGEGEIFTDGCMKAIHKGIYLINFHILKPYVTSDEWYENKLTVTLQMRPGLEEDGETITRSAVEDQEERGNCHNCDHALSQTLVLKVNVNNYICLQVVEGEVSPSKENIFSALLLRKL
uniref:Toxin candidate TRINITY_DN19135_c2_g2_i2 n=1 Tax=Ceriantheomorphe brasiliensis TaxID=1048506 RepID=A0A7G7WZ50_9CNID|nr:toxin candidate TRINITY_DN19135_c2_g2_i2 [Ceriantheomorphe brasiliensis]